MSRPKGTNSAQNSVDSILSNIPDHPQPQQQDSDFPDIMGGFSVDQHTVKQQDELDTPVNSLAEPVYDAPPVLNSSSVEDMPPSYDTEMSGRPKVLQPQSRSQKQRPGSYVATTKETYQGKTTLKQSSAQSHIFRVLPSQAPAPGLKTNGFKGAPMYIKSTDNILWAFRVSEDGTIKPVGIRERNVDVSASDIQFFPRTIRYVYGAKSIFEDEQHIQINPQTGSHPMLDNPSNRDALVFTNFEKRVNAGDIILYEYLHCMNQCQNQHPYARRNSQYPPKFQLLDFGQFDAAKVTRGKLREECYGIATTAHNEEMMPHARYLNILFIVPETGESRDMEAIREDYKEVAYNNPELFKKTYNDPRVKLMYWIRNAHEDGELALGSIKPGQAHWASSNSFICLLPPDKGAYEHLVDFSLIKEGEEFASNLRAYNITRGH